MVRYGATVGPKHKLLKDFPHIVVLIAERVRADENVVFLRRRPFGVVVTLNFDPVDYQLRQFFIGQVASATSEFIEDSKIRRTGRLIRLKREIRTMDDEVVSLKLS